MAATSDSHPTAPFMGVLEGFHVVLDGSCNDPQDVSSRSGDSKTFKVPLILDQYMGFSWQCCKLGGNDSKDNLDGRKGAKISHDVMKEIDSCTCVTVQGDPWLRPKSNGFIIILEPVTEILKLAREYAA